MKNKTSLKKIVLTGGPCSGKSTIINALRNLGFGVLDEVAREVLAEGKYSRQKNYVAMQTEILKRQLKKEELVTNLTFLDRSAVDGIGYCLLYLNNLPKSFRETNLRERYDKVFLLDRFPLQKDGLRVESDDAEAQRVHDKIREAYLITGYNPIQVPRMPVEDRVCFILNRSGVELK